MNRSLTKAAAALGVVAVAACSHDLVNPTSRLSSPGEAQLTRVEKVTVCHAAGRAGTTKYVSITIAPQGAAAHFGNNGTPKAGHELDFLATADRPCNAPEAAQLIICKASSANDPSTADPNVSFSFTTNEGDPFSLKFGECKTFSDLFPEGVTITEAHDPNAPNAGSYFATSETEVGGLQVSALGFNSVRPASATNAVENLTTVAGQTATVTFYNRN